jgi:hypothetical protein
MVYVIPDYPVARAANLNTSVATGKFKSLDDNIISFHIEYPRYVDGVSSIVLKGYMSGGGAGVRGRYGFIVCAFTHQGRVARRHCRGGFLNRFPRRVCAGSGIGVAGQQAAGVNVKNACPQAIGKAEYEKQNKDAGTAKVTATQSTSIQGSHKRRSLSAIDG